MGLADHAEEAIHAVAGLGGEEDHRRVFEELEVVAEVLLRTCASPVRR